MSILDFLRNVIRESDAREQPLEFEEISERDPDQWVGYEAAYPAYWENTIVPE